MTSVKEFRVSREPTADSLGRGSFLFTDHYSVFDWGKMPDTIPEKGQSLCTMGAFNFELLESEGIPTHYRGVVVDEEVQPLVSALDMGTPPAEMAIALTTVPDLPFVDGDYDYAAYMAATHEHYLIPLEIVFRNTVPVGSSLRRRVSPAEVGLTVSEWPDETVSLPEPVIEFSTKFERQDRYLTRDEAQRIAGKPALSELESVAHDVNRVITEQAEQAGFTHHDGKIECLWSGTEVRVADVAGTFDENRFSVDGQQLSKEVLRQYHKRTQPEWVEAVAAAKKQATADGVADWRARCERSPKPLPREVIETARNLYCAGTNAYLDREVFDAPLLSVVLERLC